MRNFTTQLLKCFTKVLVLLFLQSKLLPVQAASLSVTNLKNSEPVYPVNMLSGPTLKFRSIQQVIQKQQSTMKASGVHFEAPIPNHNNSAVKPDVIKDVCDRYDVDGCSIPFHLPFFFKQLFTPSCDRHDICYHCGVSRRITRIKCDETFRDNMRKACQTTDYVDKPWKGWSSHKSDEETKQHRVAIQQLLEDKTQFLTDLMENATHEIKKDIGDTLRLLTSPLKIKLLRENVILKWALVLSEFVRGSDKSKDSFTSKSGQSDSIDIKKSILSKRQTFWETRVKPSRHNKKSLAIFHATKHVTYGNDAKTTSAETPEHDLCTVILKVADDISMRYRHYHISDLLDCEDVDRLECLYTSNIYFIAVRLFGDSSYLKTAEKYCTEGFVNGCLPQS